MDQIFMPFMMTTNGIMCFLSLFSFSLAMGAGAYFKCAKKIDPAAVKNEPAPIHHHCGMGEIHCNPNHAWHHTKKSIDQDSLTMLVNRNCDSPVPRDDVILNVVPMGVDSNSSNSSCSISMNHGGSYEI